MQEKMNKEEFCRLIEHLRDVIRSGEYDKCPCPKIKCEWHGRCRECVILHRYGGDHVPNCLQYILEDKIKAIANTVELEVKKKPMTPGSYWDYINEVSPPADRKGETD